MLLTFLTALIPFTDKLSVLQTSRSTITNAKSKVVSHKLWALFRTPETISSEYKCSRATVGSC